jgi:hypothetical protein
MTRPPTAPIRANKGTIRMAQIIPSIMITSVPRMNSALATIDACA